MEERLRKIEEKICTMAEEKMVTTDIQKQIQQTVWQTPPRKRRTYRTVVTIDDEN